MMLRKITLFFLLAASSYYSFNELNAYGMYYEEGIKTAFSGDGKKVVKVQVTTDYNWTNVVLGQYELKSANLAISIFDTSNNKSLKFFGIDASNLGIWEYIPNYMRLAPIQVNYDGTKITIGTNVLIDLVTKEVRDLSNNNLKIIP